MEFNEKLQELRKQKGLTQEELAGYLFVSRTAVSKWESGRGYPNIESLKAIAAFFSVTVDELLSSEEILTAAQEDKKQTEKRFLCTVFGLLDMCASLFFFLPLFATRAEGHILEVSLAVLGGVPPYLKALYFSAVIATVIMGVLELALQSCTARIWVRTREKLSIALGACAVLLFVAGLQPYAAVFAFSLLAVKAFMLIKRQ